MAMQLAQAAIDAKKEVNFEHALEEVFRLAPDLPDALGLKAFHELSKLLEIGEPIENFPKENLVRAKALIDRAVVRPRQPFPGWRALALARYQQLAGQPILATKTLLELKRHRRILLAQPAMHEELYLLAADIYMAAGQPDGALRELRAGMVDIKGHAQARLWERLSALYAAASDFNSAITCIQEARRRQPRAARLDLALARVWAGKARQLSAVHGPDAYETLVTEAMKLAPNLAILHWLEAKILRVRKHFEAALARVRLALPALREDPQVQREYLEILKAAGLAKLLAGQQEQAFRHFRELMDKAGKDFPLGFVPKRMRSEFERRMKLGVKAVEKADWSLAAEHYADAVLLFPDNPRALRNLGIAQAQSGQPGLAEKSLRRSLYHAERYGLDPGASAYYLIRILKESGQNEKALKEAELYLDGAKKDLIPEGRMRAHIDNLRNRLRRTQR